MGGQAGSGLVEGDVTFVMLDVEDSTSLLSRFGDDACARVFAGLHGLARRVAEDHDGAVWKTVGDGAFASFHDPTKALAAGRALVTQLAAHAWAIDARPRVRVVIHRGTAVVRDGEYVSMALHQLARLSHAAHGDQVVVTGDVITDLPRDDVADLVPLGEFWVRGFVAPVRLHEAPTSLDGDFGPPDLPRADLTNITRTAPNLIGRDDLLAHVHRSIAESRLVTLVGPGGVGKTSMAVAVARAVADAGSAFWLVDLSTADRDTSGDSASEELRLVGVLGRALSMASEDTTAVLDRLSTRQVTLLIDNCEQLREPAARLVARILDRCPGASVLATSREALQLPSEVVIPVTPLTINSSITLFAERARLVAPHFEITTDNHESVSELCVELDCLPLALELAASLLRSATAGEVLRRLRERGELPASGAGRPARHASLEAVVNGSLATCSPDELIVFRALAAFAGPTPADAVAAVCGRDVWETSDLLGALVDRNLVTSSGSEFPETRFGMLVTLRRVARRLLRDAGEERDVAVAHAQWVREAANVAQDADADAVQAAEWLVPEMLLAVERGLVIGLSAEVLTDIARNQILRLGTRATSLAWKVFDAVTSDPDASAVALSHAYAIVCNADNPDSDVNSIRAHLEEAIRTAQRAGDDEDLLTALVETVVGGNGLFAATSPTTDVEWSALGEAEAVLDRMGARGQRWTCRVHTAAAIAHERAGDLFEARRRYVLALREAERLGFKAPIALATNNLADMDQVEGDITAAAKGFAAAAEQFAAIEYHGMHAQTAWDAAVNLALLGDLVLAADCAADAVLAARRSGSSSLLAMTLTEAAKIASRSGDRAAAQAFAAESVQIAPEGDYAPAAREILSAIG